MDPSSKTASAQTRWLTKVSTVVVAMTVLIQVSLTPPVSALRALVAEADSLADLWLRSRKASASSIPPTVHSDEEVRQWFNEAVVPSREVWVADLHGDLVALMVLDGQ